MAATRRGAVTAYDSAAGLGTVVADGEEFLLHCTEIPDGTREIATGTVIDFVEVVRFGIREATGVSLVGSEVGLR